MTSLNPRRIQWRDARPHEIEVPADQGTLIGTIGANPGQRITIAKIVPIKPDVWNLFTFLPGFVEGRHASSDDDAKALADQLLAGFISRCGAEFVEGPR